MQWVLITANQGNESNVGQKEKRYNIRVLDRAISVLSVLSDGKARTLMELSETIALNSSTTFRLLSALAFHNYVERDEQTGKYALGLACLELARSYQMSNHVRRAALPVLETLRDETGETIHLAILDDMEVVYLEKLHGLHAIGLMTSRVGGRLPAHCTGLGKSLLAFTDPEDVEAYFAQTGLHRFTDATITSIDELMRQLEEVRRTGYAFDRGEHEVEVRCVAVPIFDINAQAVAALSISGPANRMEPLETNREYIDRALQAARTISTRLGYRQKGPNLRGTKEAIDAEDNQST